MVGLSRLADINGDGKADYVWIDPNTGETHAWINNLPNPWSPAVPLRNSDIIASGAGRGSQIFLADMNGDGVRLNCFLYRDFTHK
jgi:hypothetical protein